MFFNYKKRTTILVAISVLLIVLSFILFFFNICQFLYQLFLSLGCGLLPTIIITDLVEKHNLKIKEEKNQRLRLSFLRGIPLGISMITKVIVEESFLYSKESVSDESMINIFIKSISKLKVLDYNDDHYTMIKKRIDDRLNAGVSLCVEHSKDMINSEEILKINDIFSEEELNTIVYMNDELTKISSISIICEKAEILDLVVNEMVEKIPEIKKILGKNVKIVNGKLMNYFDFM